jgi:hypothetical protein
MPVDIPLVRPSTVKTLIDSFPAHPERILYPAFDSLRGHPVLVPSSLVPEILGWTGEGGLKAVLDAHETAALDVPVPDEFILADMDTRDDYADLARRLTRYGIPSEKECTALLDIAGTADNIRRHCRAVADIASRLAGALVAAGQPVDTGAVRAAALVHDIAKMQPRHAGTGAGLLRDAGFTGISDIVALHTALEAPGLPVTLEAKLVYLADKYAREAEPVTLEERYRSAAARYGDAPHITGKIMERLDGALAVRDEIGSLLGYPPEKLVFG